MGLVNAAERGETARPIRNELLAFVRVEDRDRYLSVLLAPTRSRDAMLALHAYDLTLAAVVRTTSEPGIGLIRLAWWRDAVGDAAIEGQPVLAGLKAAAIDPAMLAGLAEGHMDWLEGGKRPAELLFALGARLLGTGDAPVGEAARIWAAGQECRAGRHGEVPPTDAAMPSAVRSLTALAAASRRDLAGRREPRGSLGRQLAMFRHLLTGRL